MCLILSDHSWTSLTQQDIKPTKKKLTKVDDFWIFAKMYCHRCGCSSKLNPKGV